MFCARCRKQPDSDDKIKLHAQSEKILLKYCQENAFSDDLKQLKTTGQVSTSSKLASLNPHIGSDQLLRVRGRLENADLPPEMKAPIILPSNDHLTHLIIDDLHRKNGHVGLKHVISKLRERFWVLRCVSEVKRILGRCIFCRRFHRPLMTQQMAPLPEECLSADNPPFHTTGIDYFGPLHVRVGRSSVKRWGVIFTCLACRAVHLEVAHTLNTDSFLAAFSRFTARRGTPSLVYSDNGTNLTAAEKELREMIDGLDKDKINDKHKAIGWKFIPPGASHMAGVWERLVRSVKTILQGLLEKETKKLLSDEGLYTLLCEVECILNDRPISMNPTGLDDAPALTPNMLLTFQRRTITSLENYDPKEAYSQRWWRHVQHLASVFWRRFVAEYVPTLQNRPKWRRSQPSIKLGDIVLVSDINLPRGEWPLGRITELQHGQDGHVRIVKVLVAGKERLRPITRLCLLEQNSC